MNSIYFVKSLEEDFYTKTIKNNKKVNFQSLDNIIKTKIIKPNTKSFNRKRRLSTTILHKNYQKTYRPQGIIFQTKYKPDHILPFDLVLLSTAKKIVVHYFRIKNSIHIYYNHDLLPGFNKFIFKTFDELIKKFPNTERAWNEVNKFRKKSGYNELPKQKYRLVEYNEAVFYKQIKVKPIAIFGYRKKARQLAKKYNLPHFVTAKEFYKKYN